MENPESKKSLKSLEACRYTARAVREAGGRAWLVGGCVRDKILGVPQKDFDLEIYGLSPEKIGEILSKKFRVESVGKSFGVWILKGLNVDVSAPRKERKSSPGHRGFDVECDPFLPPEKACSRRDFTMNALLEDPLSGEILDPLNGAADLRAGILRHCSERFLEDPLRVLRAAQFCARFDLDAAPETVEICSRTPFENLPGERVYEEWKKLVLKGVRISKGLFFLRDCGWLKFFPPLYAALGCPQDPQWHPEGDVFTHTALCMDAFARERTGDEKEDLAVGFAVLCHDLGKPLCTVRDADGRIRSPRHDILGVKPAREFLESMTREKSLIAAVLPLVERHMAILDLWRSGAGDSAIRRLAKKAGRIDRLARVDDADRRGRGGEDPGPSPQGLWILERAAALSVKDRAPVPLLMGRHLLKRGIPPGPEYGGILAEAYRAQLDGEFSDLDGAVVFLNKLLDKRGRL